MFTFFQELWKLIKMLFQSNPNDMQEVELMAMEKFPFPGYKYMMWCGKMIYRKENEEDILAEKGTGSFIKDTTHETIHLKQAQLKKSWIGFYWKYVCEWIKGDPIKSPSISAYYTIPYEMEAYANEDNPDYPKNYDGKYLHYYDIENRKEAYKKCGSSYKWKQYIKTIEKTV